MTLADISVTVEHINKSINDRKAKLAPEIKKLRQMRQEFTVRGRYFYLSVCKDEHLLCDWP